MRIYTNSMVLLMAAGLFAAGCADAETAAKNDPMPLDGEGEAIGESAEMLQIAWPVAAWGFDVNCSGSTVYDSSSNDLHGTRSGGVNCTVGAKGGKALLFDGTDGMVEIPDNAALNFTTAMTVSTCVRPQSPSSGTILGKWYAFDSYQLGMSSGHFYFEVAFPGGTWGIVKWVEAPSVENVWQHVVGVYNGSSLHLYINGNLVASTPASGTLQQSTRPVVIGNHPAWSAFTGAIDHAYLYGRALSVAEIVTLKEECLN
jgi:hypothetical protein